MAAIGVLTGRRGRHHAEEQRRLRRLAMAVAAEKPLDEILALAEGEAASLAGAWIALVTCADAAGSEVVRAAGPESALSLPPDASGAPR